MSETITVEFDVPARMRDGTVLRANVFRPGDGAGGPYPVALARTPYGKDLGAVSRILDAPRLARAGYIVAIQDVRGRFASEGEWSPFRHEAADGYDSVEWAARLPGGSGAVGMFGASYLGFTQWMAATQSPPCLKAIAPTVTWADARDGAFWRGGALELGTMGFWQVAAIAFDVLQRRYRDAPPEDQMRAMGAWMQEMDRLPAEGYAALPLAEFAPFRRLEIAPEMFELIEAPYSRDAAAPYSPAEMYDHVIVPALNIGGWYDIFTQGTLRNFAALRAAGRTPEARQARVVIGPWAHGDLGNVVGQLDFGFAASTDAVDLTGLTQRWFDHWLKGIDNGAAEEAPVRLFVMGANTWRDEQEWPLARTEYTPFYLHSAGGANTPRGDGVLSTEPPHDEPADHYTYDPASPTPTNGGALLLHPVFKAGAWDQRPTESRDDVLVYTSAPLEKDTEVTGPITVTLWAASDAMDTDFVARLVDVHADGFAQNLTDGIVRARFRHGEISELLEPGRPYQYTINLWSTANVFKAGHRIRLDVASANFPRWDRNPNTGAPFGRDAALRSARQTILHDAAHPSHVRLPIIPAP